ncbi:MAG: biotin transporter BioY [Lachnospiraceae bacterium]|nr:biotin transporter BioY [Lachnospiraceae bacterium]
MNGRTKQMTYTALATALICVLGPFTIQIPISPVPISLTIFAIYIAVYALGMKRGVVATALYILLGLIGVPVFSGFTGGAGKLLGPTGGYIIGYLFTAAISGWFIDRFEEKKLLYIPGMVLGTLVCYLFGTAWLAKTAGMGFLAALYAGVIPFIPADAVKILCAYLTGPRLRNALRRL